MTKTLYLERPSFWTETRDPEAWFRAIEAVALASRDNPATGTPRTVAERSLQGIIAWRGAVGLFGASEQPRSRLLHGVGLIAKASGDAWVVTPEAEQLVRAWRSTPEHGWLALADYVVRESPWLRLLLLRLLGGDWRIKDWQQLRTGRVGLKAGHSLQLDRFSDSQDWFSGLENSAAGQWQTRLGCARLAIAPAVAARKKGKDNLSLAPLTAPLHLLESVGWLSPHGALLLPLAVLAELTGQSSAADTLTQICVRRADVRGFVAVEPALRELLVKTAQASPPDDEFARWMDQVTGDAIRAGAIELLAAEPGQARHGRGLGGDPERKLVRWVIHKDFNQHFQRTWAALAGALGKAGCQDALPSFASGASLSTPARNRHDDRQ